VTVPSPSQRHPSQAVHHSLAITASSTETLVAAGLTQGIHSTSSFLFVHEIFTGNYAPQTTNNQPQPSAWSQTSTSSKKVCLLLHAHPSPSSNPTARHQHKAFFCGCVGKPNIFLLHIRKCRICRRKTMWTQLPLALWTQPFVTLSR
jgi:hypothetical protein